MPAGRSLPIRPSLESLRKEAKRFMRAVAAGDADALTRTRAQLPRAEPPLSLRDAQLVVAREYGFAGWNELRAEVLARTGDGLTWAASEAARTIHDDDLDRLQQLLAAHPTLVSAHDASGVTLLARAVTAFGDCRDPNHERMFTRPRCAEALIDAGAAFEPALWNEVLRARSRGLLELLWNKGVLPRTLPVFAAVGDLEAIRARPSDVTTHTQPAELREALTAACRFAQTEAAAFLLLRYAALDRELAERIDRGPGRNAFIASLIERSEMWDDPWRAYVQSQAQRALAADDSAALGRWLDREPFLAESLDLLEEAVYTNRASIVEQLIARGAAALRGAPPPSAALEYAFEYGNSHLVPVLTRMWSLPDDLPHAAGAGDMARVKAFFDDDGRLRRDARAKHYPLDNPRKLGHLQWRASDPQHVLDTALAWTCLNHRFEIAEFLLERGANVNSDWSTHEPASILHECVMQKNYAAAQFAIDHGADLAKRDYRWNATPEEWARHATEDETMAEFLADAGRKRRLDPL